MLTVGDRFPEFNVDACVGNGKDGFKKIHNKSYEGKWVCYFFYPKDFTFICPTEIVEFGKKLKDFRDRDCEVIGGSTDNEFSHQAWRNAHPDLKDLPFPLIAATKLAFDLGIVDPNAHACLRATFLVDPNGVIQYSCAHPLSVGRSIPEVLRTLDAIQSDELCPCNWTAGQATIKV
jgi:alkyl hydroperoxide reductase subunit AhpC